MTNNENSFIKLVEKRLDLFFELHGKDTPDSGLYDRFISETEKILIKKTLNHVNGVQTKASRILGISRNTLRKKMKVLNIN